MQIFTRFYLLLASIVFVLFLPAITNAEILHLREIAIIEETANMPIPYFSYMDKNHEEHTVDFNKYKLTALHFWATSCVPCVKEFPELNKVQKKYANAGLKIIALSRDNINKNSDKVSEFYKNNQIDSLEMFFDTDQAVTFYKMNVNVLPFTIFVNPEGKSIARIVGAFNWGKKEMTDFIESQLSGQIPRVGKSNSNKDFFTFP